MSKNPFHILGITKELCVRLNKEAVADLVKAQRRNLLVLFHPDKQGKLASTEKFREVSDAFEVIDPDNPNSQFNLLYAKLKKGIKVRQTPSDTFAESNKRLTEKLAVASQSVRNVLHGLVSAQNSPVQASLFSDALVAKVNLLQMDHPVYLMIRGSDGKMFGVIIEEGGCRIYSEKKITKGKQVSSEELEQGQRFIHKGDTQFLLQPIHTEQEHTVVGSLGIPVESSSKSVPSGRDAGFLTGNGVIASFSSEAGVSMNFDQLSKIVSKHCHYSPFLELDANLLTRTVDEDDEETFHVLGKISRISEGADFLMDEVSVSENDGDGMYILNYRGEKMCACTLERFALDRGFDIHILQHALRKFDVDCISPTGQEDSEIYRLQSLLRLSQRVMAKDRFVYYDYKNLDSRAIDIENYMKLQERQGKGGIVPAAQLYPLVERGALPRVGIAYVYTSDTGNYSRKSVYDIAMLNNIDA